MADRKDRKRGLGRGLSALMADVAEAETPAAQGGASAEQMVPIERIAPNADQARKTVIARDKADAERAERRAAEALQNG